MGKWRSPWWANMYNCTISYLSVVEALTHGGIENDVKVKIRWVDSENVTEGNVTERAGRSQRRYRPRRLWRPRYRRHALLHPLGQRDSRCPCFGICLGMQMSVVEHARHLAGMVGAHSSELDPDTALSGH